MPRGVCTFRASFGREWSTADVRRGGLAQIASRNEYDKTIAETEAAYMKILESSQTLLNVLKRETVNLVK